MPLVIIASDDALSCHPEVNLGCARTRPRNRSNGVTRCSGWKVHLLVYNLRCVIADRDGARQHYYKEPIFKVVFLDENVL